MNWFRCLFGAEKKQQEEVCESPFDRCLRFIGNLEDIVSHHPAERTNMRGNRVHTIELTDYQGLIRRIEVETSYAQSRSDPSAFAEAFGVVPSFEMHEYIHCVTLEVRQREPSDRGQYGTYYAIDGCDVLAYDTQESFQTYVDAIFESLYDTTFEATHKELA